MFRFAHSEYLYFLLAIPVFILIFWISTRMRKRNLENFGNPDIVKELMPDVSASRPVIKFIITMFALAFLIIGIAAPQLGSKLEEVKREGVELVICLDVSNSMLAEDIKPSRLERAKRAIYKLIDRLHNDKIGLIVFAGQAYTQLPVTTDYGAAKMFVSAVNTNQIPVQGTAIGTAIETAIKSFSSEKDKNRAIIVITDGENHEDDAMSAASEASKKGIYVHTIGMGLPQGAPIPVQMKYSQKDYRKDKQGNVIISKLDENMLQQIAASGSGVYIRANNTTTGLNTLFDEIEKMNKQEFETTTYSDYEDRFQYVIFFALLFLLVESMILNRKNRLFKGKSIFNKSIYLSE